MKPILSARREGLLGLMVSVGSLDGARILINSGSQFTRVAARSGRLVCADDTARESPRAASGGAPKGQHPRNLSGIRGRAGQASLEPASERSGRGGLRQPQQAARSPAAGEAPLKVAPPPIRPSHDDQAPTV